MSIEAKGTLQARSVAPGALRNGATRTLRAEKQLMAQVGTGTLISRLVDAGAETANARAISVLLLLRKHGALDSRDLLEGVDSAEELVALTSNLRLLSVLDVVSLDEHSVLRPGSNLGVVLRWLSDTTSGVEDDGTVSADQPGQSEPDCQARWMVAVLGAKTAAS